jgi:hypothetical protein
MNGFQQHRKTVSLQRTKVASYLHGKTNRTFTGRSPCPGLNILANHGYLPRSGKNIDLPAIQNGVAAAYNYEPTTFDDVFAMVQDYKLTTTGNISTFNLEDLVKHGYLEFDGSLSRNDFYFGDALHFDPAIWAVVSERLALNKITSDPASKYVTIETAAKVRAERVADAMRVNPTFNASTLEQQGSPGTTALWLTTLWDDSVGGAPKEWIKLFFGKLICWLLANPV